MYCTVLYSTVQLLSIRRFVRVLHVPESCDDWWLRRISRSALRAARTKGRPTRLRVRGTGPTICAHSSQWMSPSQIQQPPADKPWRTREQLADECARAEAPPVETYEPDMYFTVRRAAGGPRRLRNPNGSGLGSESTMYSCVWVERMLSC